MNAQTDIAVIGMAGRFPGAASVEQLWQRLKAGEECLTHFTQQELLAAGVDPALLSNPHYVRSNGKLDDIDCFDATFFGYSPREAEIIDPQQRLFVECAHEVLDKAGYGDVANAGRIGVFAGARFPTYLLYNIMSHPELTSTIGEYPLMLGNGTDYISTRTSWLLNLKGPSVTVQTACSTSLVAIHQACQSLLSYETDIALAGGGSIYLQQDAGYLYEPGGVLSPDGRCRPFDANAQGMVNGNAVAVVALKRLSDALADGDNVLAVVKGTAIGNDGNAKVGFTAPSVEGQAATIAEAYGVANIDPASISYIECHGTATALGDPIEIEGLTEVFGTGAGADTCAIGSLKSNIGHTDVAAGVAGFIKAVLCLQHQTLTPSLHFQSPNQRIDFAATPFYVNTVTKPWSGNGQALRAAVSGFGMGGTNAHVILEQAPPLEPIHRHQRGFELIVLSAKSARALEQTAARLAQHLTAEPNINLTDVAFTTQVGRQQFSHRRVIIAANREEAIRALEGQENCRVKTRMEHEKGRSGHFQLLNFSAEHISAIQSLYADEAVFQSTFAAHASLGVNAAVKCALVELILSWGVVASSITAANVNSPALAVLQSRVEPAGRSGAVSVPIGPGLCEPMGMLALLADMWLAGAKIDWRAYHAGGARRVPLPGYPFERQRHWIAPAARGTKQSQAGAAKEVKTTTLAARPQLDTAWVGPRSEMEQNMCTALGEALGIANVGIHDNFFELGGHSLLATQMLAAIGKELGISLSPGLMFDASTAALLAVAVTEAIAAQNAAPSATASVDELSEAELDAALAEMLNTGAKP